MRVRVGARVRSEARLRVRVAMEDPAGMAVLHAFEGTEHARLG